MLLNKDKISELRNIKNSELQKIYEKLAMTSQFDLTRLYDVIMRNLLF